MVDLFGDETGGFHLAAKDHEELIVRTRDAYDGAMPSGVSVAAHVLFRWAELTSDEAMKKRARDALARHAAELMGAPHAYPHLASAADMSMSPWRQIVIAGDSAAMLREVRSRYLPNTVVLVAPSGGADAATLKLLPGLEGKKSGAYVCENFTCLAPVQTAAELAKILDAK
jgi:hypothetical protein